MDFPSIEPEHSARFVRDRCELVPWSRISRVETNVPHSSADELTTMHVPTLLLMGDREVLCDPASALARARRLIPHAEGELVANCRHDMCFSQHRIVDARVLDFLSGTRRNVPQRDAA